MYRHYAGRLLVLVMAALIWLGYDNIDVIETPLLWPYRYLILALAAFLLLTVVHRLAGLYDSKQKSDA
ncbi:MAG: hypothetical protein RIC87_06090 [Kiloniellales bacterium]